MNDEQNKPETDLENTGAAKGASTADSALQSQAVSGSDRATQDDYYDIDYAKKEVLSTIGDGEMHDEGLVGAGEGTTDIQSSTERLTDEQDEAESHDSEQ